MHLLLKAIADGIIDEWTIRKYGDFDGYSVFVVKTLPDRVYSMSKHFTKVELIMLRPYILEQYVNNKVEELINQMKLAIESVDKK